MITKDQLIFDPTAADTTECDTVGSYILDSAGNAITSTDVGGGVQALDVNVAGGSLTTTVDLNFATDQVDTSGSVIALDAATLAALEDITATVSGTVALDAATLTALEDINATVSGTVSLDAATLAALEDVTATVSGTVALDAATLTALEEVTVSATDLDIRDLSAATDSVSISDGTNDLAVNADGSLNVQFAASGKQTVVETNNGIANSAVTATNTAAAITPTALTDRTKLLVQNTGNRAVFVGDSSVTTATGVRIPKGGNLEINVSDAISLFAVTSAGTADLRIIELACS